MRLDTRGILSVSAIALAIGNLGRVPFIEVGGRRGAVSLLDLVLIPLWMLLFVKLPWGQRAWRFDALSRALLLFLALATVSTVLAGPRWGLGVGDWLSSAAFLVRWALYAGFFVLVVSDPDARAVSAVAWKRFELAILCVAAFGILQSAFIPELGIKMFALTGIPADPQGRRLVSTLLDPQLAGGLLAFGLLFFVARAAEGLPTSRLPLLVLSAALLLTLSRSAILGFAAGVAVIVAVRGFSAGLRRLALIGAALLLPVLPALVAFATDFNKLGVDGSALQRLIPWLRSVTMIKDAPVVGVGFNAAAHAQRAYGWTAVGGSDVSMDGGLLFIAVMTGLAGLSAFLLMLHALWRAARRTWRSPAQDPAQRAFAIATVAGTMAVVMQSFFTNSLLTPWLMLPMWVAWARVVVNAPVVAAARSRRSSITPRLRALGVSGAGVLLLTLSACEPCAGLANCSDAERRVLTGTILSRATDAAAPNVLVDIEGIVARTNVAGRWRIELPPGPDIVHVRVGGDSGYVATDILAPAVRVTGDATELGAWYDRPAFGYIVGFTFREEPLLGAQVQFQLEPADGGAVLTTSVAGGPYLRFAGPAPRLGPVSGTFTVTHPLTGIRVFDGVSISADYRPQIERIRGLFKTDGRYPYGGNVLFRGTYQPSPGTTVTFTRTGGRELVQNPVSVVAGDGGFFFFELEPLGRGAIVGDLTLTPPNDRPPYVYRNLQLSTYDSTNVRNIGVYAHGEIWDWVFEMRRTSDSSLVTWTPFEFVRTGGLALEGGDVVRGQSNGSGRLLVRASVLDTGTVTGTLTLRPSGSPPVTVGEVSLRTFAADSQRFAGVRFVDWYGRYPYGGNVLFRGTYQPSPGTTVTFTRTGGRELRQNSVSVVAGDGGFFFFELEPLGKGSIVGDLTLTPPNDRPPYVYRNLQLSTYDSTNVRNIGVYAHGERWDWVFEMRRSADSSLVTWTPFEFVRTGGLALEGGDVVRGQSNGSGRLLVRASVLDTGTVTGTLTLLPSGGPPVTVGPVSLRTFAADSQRFAGVRFVGIP